MSDPRRVAPVVAIIDWRAAAALKDNTIFLRRAGLHDDSRQRRRRRTVEHRSLIVRADGSAELQRFTAATAARRLLAAVGGDTTRQTRTEQRG